MYHREYIYRVASQFMDDAILYNKDFTKLLVGKFRDCATRSRESLEPATTMQDLPDYLSRVHHTIVECDECANLIEAAKCVWRPNYLIFRRRPSLFIA